MEYYRIPKRQGEPELELPEWIKKLDFYLSRKDYQPRKAKEISDGREK